MRIKNGGIKLAANSATSVVTFSIAQNVREVDGNIYCPIDVKKGNVELDYVYNFQDNSATVYV